MYIDGNVVLDGWTNADYMYGGVVSSCALSMPVLVFVVAQDEVEGVVEVV